MIWKLFAGWNGFKKKKVTVHDSEIAVKVHKTKQKKERSVGRLYAAVLDCAQLYSAGRLVGCAQLRSIVWIS